MNKKQLKFAWIILSCLQFTSIESFAQSVQKPDFSLVGFGAATTGGNGGTEVTVTSLSQLISEAKSSGKKIIKIDRTIEATGTTVEVSNDKTILGIGNKAFLKGISLHLKNVQNVIIRNLKMTMIGGSGKLDIISGETTGSNTGGNYWIDHCEFYNEYPTLPETAAKKDKYDGILDFKQQVSNITISWCYIHDHWKCSLIGFSTDKDSYDKKITYHHNWFKNIKSRTPSYRAGTSHIYNNFYDGLNDPQAPKSDGVHSRDKACLFVEGNYFLNYEKSIYWDEKDSPTEAFVDESGVANSYVNSPKNTARTCSFKPPYNVKVDAADKVPEILKAFAGIGKLDGSSIVYNTSETNFKLSPSMNGNAVELSLPSNDASTIAIFNLSGRKILEKKFTSSKVNLNIADLNSGMYIINFAYKGETMQQRIVKK